MATVENVSVYQDMISNCVKIQSGSPAVYKLRTKKEKIGTVTRITVGDKNLKKINKTILLVGETGAGKSTLINALVNYTMGVKFEDDIWFEIVEREKRSQTESQTSDVTVYEIFGFEDETLPYSLTIIDTPGYGDTRGIERNKKVSKTLFDLFCSDGVQEVSAVCLVMKASENRLTDRLRDMFDSVMSAFGRYLEKNIVTLITHSSGITPQNVLEALEVAKIKCARIKNNQPVYFQFDNCHNRERTEEDELGLENAWRVTERGMRQFSNFLETSTPQNLTKTIEMFNTRDKLTTCLKNLEKRIEEINGKRKEIQKLQKGLTENVKNMFLNENFCTEVDEVYTEREHVRFEYLLFFDETRYIDVVRTRTVKKIQEGMKKEYDKNKAESQRKLDLLEKLENEMRDLTPKKNQLFEESYQLVLKLHEIALNVAECSLSTYDHLDSLIEKMTTEDGDTRKVQKLKEMRRRMRRS